MKMKERTYWNVGIGLGAVIVVCSILAFATQDVLFVDVGFGLFILAGLYLMGQKFLVKKR